jgi:hypothetical protein
LSAMHLGHRRRERVCQARWERKECWFGPGSKLESTRKLAERVSGARSFQIVKDATREQRLRSLVSGQREREREREREGERERERERERKRE